MNIIVTGASRGIGYEVARKFSVDKDNTVLVISRNKAGLADLKQKCIEAKHGSGIHLLPFDLENLEGIEGELKHKILDHFDSLDILINNAGLLIKKTVMELAPAEVYRMMTVNYLSPMILVRTLLPLLEKAEKAHVVNIGSMAGVQGVSKFPGLSAYSSSKAAIHVLTECLTAELINTGIHFNSLALGVVQTEMLDEAFPGLKAPLEAGDMADFIKDFAINGKRYFNGKILPVELSSL